MAAHPHDPDVLEIRIHGVQNTPPAEMLGAEKVVRAQADAVAGFWVSADPVDPNRPAPSTHTEAYSWGLLARTGGTALPLLGQLVAHVFWLLLLPFGLCNVAYWTRRIPVQDRRNGWTAGIGGGTSRLFALALTLFFVSGISTVALDLVGVQCYKDAGVCAQLPTVFDWLASLPRHLRLTVLALVPIAAVLVLDLVGRRGRVRYESEVTDMADDMARNKRERAPVLATAGFWGKVRIGPTTERLHIAAALLFLTLVLAADRVAAYTAAGRGGCRTPAGAATPCDAGPVGIPGSITIGVLAAALLALIGVLIVRVSETPSSPTEDALEGAAPDQPQKDAVDREVRASSRTRRRRALVVLSVAILLFAAQAVVGGWGLGFGAEVPSAFPARAVGLASSPTVLIIVMMGIALSAIRWRAPAPRPLVTALVWIAVLLVLNARVGLLDIVGASSPTARTMVLVVALAAVVVLVGWTASGLRSNEDARAEGWWGAGPAVVLLLALGAALTLTSLLVIGVSGFLSASSEDRTVVGIIRLPDDRPASEAIGVPSAYVQFGVALLVVVALVGIVALSFVAKRFASLPTLLAPRFPGKNGRERRIPDCDAYPDGEPEKTEPGSNLERRVLQARRFAALAHGAEPLLGLLAAAFAAAMVWIVVVPDDWTAVSDVRSAVASAVLGAVALALLAAVGANALTVKERPVGLLWDLICFLPRAGHPFSPPCYSERAVPELQDRVRDWLGGGVPARRRVVLSAHSLGAVLGVATILTRYAEKEDRPLPSIGLLTFGTQLRPYFGRFFPELFGPRVLGTAPSRMPNPWSRDPWQAQIADDYADGAPAPVADETPTLVRLLQNGGPTPAWVNLWRRTDYLGFPVHSYESRAPDDDPGGYRNPIDRGATELDPGPYGTVASHSHYPAVPQYEAALREVIGRIGPRVP